MPIDIPGRYQSPWGDLRAPIETPVRAGPGLTGAGGSALKTAGGAAGGILGMPWSVIIPILLSVFGGLFEKKEDPLEEALTLKQQMGTLGIEPPYQNPYLPQMSEAAFKAVMGQLQQTSGWGWPADRQPPNTDWIMEMLASAPTGTGGTRRRIRT